jgi:hypothetical protein
MQEDFQTENGRRHDWYVVEEIGFLAGELLLLRQAETTPRRRGNPTMICYPVDRLIEHSFLPAVALSANGENLSNKSCIFLRNDCG